MAAARQEQQSHGAGQAFTCFPRLPLDLQLQIWDAAIQHQQAEPLAHFVSLGNGKGERCELAELRNFAEMVHGKWTFAGGGKHFGPPVAFYSSGSPPRHEGSNETYNDQDIWGFPSNSSGYLLDSGLWGACVASRQAVLRNWRRHHPVDCCGMMHARPYDICHCGQMKAPLEIAQYGNFSASRNPLRVSISRQLSAAEGQWIVTRPEVDLFVCHAPDLKDLTGNELHRAVILWNTANVTDCHNVAMYFDLQWTQELASLDANGGVPPWESWKYIQNAGTDFSGFARLFDGLYPRFLWLIDTRTVPLEGVSYDELIKDRKVFKARDRRFVEITEDGMERTWTTRQGPDLASIINRYERRREGFKLAHGFLRGLYGHIKDHYYEEWLENEDEADADSISCSRYGMDYATMIPMVLACLPSETFGCEAW